MDATTMPHLALLGDSIFDNGVYVPGRPAVIEQVRQGLPAGWGATLVAVDGNVIADIERQLARLPAEATHLVVSIGGNDALQASVVLGDACRSVGEAFSIFSEVRAEFARAYREMVQAVAAVGKPFAVSTIYDAIPGLEPAARTALAALNEVILREAIRAGAPLIDLRLTCDQPGDYSPLSPIEPSVLGGAKIARAIVEAVTTHDFSARRSAVYW
jgi:lysophospholipase L1-like esterase